MWGGSDSKGSQCIVAKAHSRKEGEYPMVVFTERIVEDGFWLVILVLVLAFFGFRHRYRRWTRDLIEPRQSRSAQAGKKMA